MKVYLDNSATSWPKPQVVPDAISNFLTSCSASPGRSGHKFALHAAKEVFETRELIAQFFNVKSSERVVFTPNATFALNVALKGTLKKGDHIIVTAYEHNATIRPLRYLESQGIIDITIVGCNAQGNFDLEKLESCIRPNTTMVSSIHASNVTGHLLPIASIGKICRQHNLTFLVDASQSAGIIPINMQDDNIDMLVFTGHKKMYGPTGIGGICIADSIQLEPLVQGGTGSKSDMEYHPDFYPDMLEAGTPNTIGIVGLKAGLEYVISKGLDSIYAHQHLLTNLFIDGLKDIEPITIHSGLKSEKRVGVVSLTVKGIIPSSLAYALDNEYGIMVRSGLHCAPLAHKTLGTFPQGSVRFSFGCFNTQEEVNYTLDALKALTLNQ
jgi:cysteine desulfurase family protein